MRRRDDLNPQQKGRLDRYRAQVLRQQGGGKLQFLIHIGLWLVARVWFRRSADGKIPGEGLVVTANHVGHADLIAFEALAPWRRPRLAFAAMARLFMYRPVAAIVSRAGFFPVQRGHGDQAAIDASVELLQAGVPVVMMPEGQYTPGVEMGEFRRGPARIALAAGVPLLPMCTHGVAEARRAWWPKRIKLYARAGEKLYPQEGESPEALTARLREAILDLQRQLIAESEGEPPEPAKR